jgi:ATP-dependent Clp protease ATP-binding subunit ClpC
LLDEIEKAHPDVNNILLQVLDDGRLTDRKGRVIDFTNTIIIATSNIGSDIIQENLTAAKAKSYAALKEELMGILHQQFKPEFLNRIDEIILFHALTKEQIKLIVQLQLERVKRTARGQGIELKFADAVLDRLVDVGYVPELGARELKSKVQTEIETPLAREILSGRVVSSDVVRIEFDKSIKSYICRTVSSNVTAGVCDEEDLPLFGSFSNPSRRNLARKLRLRRF